MNFYVKARKVNILCLTLFLLLIFDFFARIIVLAALRTGSSRRLTFSKETLSGKLAQMLSLNTLLGNVLLRVVLLMILPFLSRVGIIRHFFFNVSLGLLFIPLFRYVIVFGENFRALR